MKELLIVDDHYSIRILLEEVFNKEGYKVHVAHNGREALRIAENENLHCVLSDIKLPDICGIEIMKKILNIKPNLPFFMMSGFSESELIKEALDNGALHVYTKPFNISELVDGVKKVLVDQ